MDDASAMFERDLDAALGSTIRRDDRFAGTVYAALCNVDWHRDGVGVARYTWRDASAVVARLRARGEHDLAYYLFGGEGMIDATVADPLVARGWRPTRA